MSFEQTTNTSVQYLKMKQRSFRRLKIIAFWTLVVNLVIIYLPKHNGVQHLPNHNGVHATAGGDDSSSEFGLPKTVVRRDHKNSDEKRTLNKPAHEVERNSYLLRFHDHTKFKYWAKKFGFRKLPTKVAENPITFVFFVGIGASSHSIIASFIDAHENALVAEEFNFFQQAIRKPNAFHGKSDVSQAMWEGSWLAANGGTRTETYKRKGVNLTFFTELLSCSTRLIWGDECRRHINLQRLVVALWPTWLCWCPASSHVIAGSNRISSKLQTRQIRNTELFYNLVKLNYHHLFAYLHPYSIALIYINGYLKIVQRWTLWIG